MNVQYTHSDKIEGIFQSTLALIREHGFHGTPMSQIAKSSDVAIGTIYHYFPSKEALILALYDYCRLQLHSYIFDPLDDQLPYKEQFSVVFKRFCSFYRAHTEEFSFMEQFYNSPFYALHEDRSSDGPYDENKIIRFLARGMAIGALKSRDLSLLSAAYIGVAVSYSKSVLYGKVDFEEKNLDELIEIIWNGVKQ